ncbi:unnamed protein product [Didymodactylos carnosus]|nr:unnamed protein product [Didymodactylos carnosus]CAF4157895.1 unnamed protein product [Didymodactylos carnosus]
MFDPEMSPSSLTREQLYNFITDRFQSPAPASVQEQALQWLQILCQLEIFIPVQLLMQIFITGVNSLQKLESRAQRREVYTSSSNEQSLRNSFEQGLNTVQGNETTQTIGQTSSLPSSAKQFLVFDTYETYRAHRHQLMLQQMTGQEMVSIIKEEEEEFIINESELNSKCSIMMIDMLLKQMELQLTPQHQGMYNPLSKEILLLLNKQLILPWTRRHHCRNLSSQCAFCEEYILWFSIANDLLKHISPRDEIKLPELEVPNVNELKQQQQQQQQQQMTKPKFNIDSAGDGPGTTVSISSSNEDEQTNGQQDPDTPAIVSSPPIQQQQVQTSLAPELKVENNPDGGVWITSHGVFYFKLNTLHIHLQFFYSALKELDRVIDIDALYYLLCCLRLLILNDECLETSAKDNRGFLIYCLERLLIPHIWKILSLGYGHLNECCVPLLLHALSYEAGKSALWAILDRDYTSTHWKVRSSAVTRVISLTQLLKPKFVKNNYNVLSVLAYSFMNLMASIEDIEPTVSQKAMCSLETLSDCAMRTVMCSLEFQFDTVISDRSLILHRLSKLYSILLQQNKQQSTTKGVLNWEFFLNRFDTLSLESQISLEESGDIVSPQSIGGFNTESEHFIRKLNQIKFAMARTDSIRPITSSIKLQQNKSIRIPAPSTTQQTRETQSSIPRRLSNLASASIHTHLTEHSETDSIASLLPDVESSDKSTLQLLVTLLMKDDQNQVGEDRIMFKHQNVVIRHLCSLLGYNQTNRTFTYSPSRLSPVFHAVLSDLPKVVDYNYSLCTILLPIFLSVLQYSTCSNATAHYFENVTQTNTLGRIDPSLRDSWLMVLIIILYKYQFTSFATTIQQLTRVAMNTILSRYHQCETPIFGIGGPTGGRLTPKVGGSRRGSSKPFDDIREIETNEVGSKYFQNGAGGEYDDGQSDVTVTDRQHKHIKLLSPPKKMKTK